MNLFKRATNRGAVDTIKLTFDALDIINALFQNEIYGYTIKTTKSRVQLNS